MAYEHLTIVDYDREFFQNRLSHTLVDVRSPSEYRSGHIPGAINIPLDELEWRTSEIPTTRPVVVVCASGNRSRTGSEILANKGYTRVYNLKGGTSSWMAGMRPVDY